MKRVLVTGGSGFIGSYSAPCLVARGYEVHMASRNAVEAASHVVSHRVDVLDPRQTEDLLTRLRPTHLLHLAWNVEPGYWTSPENAHWVSASMHLLRAFGKAGGQRCVFIGSCAEYGDDPGVCTEDRTPLSPTTQYGRSKAELGQRMLATADAYGVQSAAWARVFYLYGPGERAERIVPSSIQALRQGKVTVCRLPDEVRDYLFIQDVADALTDLLGSDVIGPVNIGSGNALSNRELVIEIARQLGREELVRFGTSPGTTTVVADIRRLTDEVGWTAGTTLTRGLERSIAAIREAIGVA